MALQKILSSSSSQESQSCSLVCETLCSIWLTAFTHPQTAARTRRAHHFFPNSLRASSAHRVKSLAFSPPTPKLFPQPPQESGTLVTGFGSTACPETGAFSTTPANMCHNPLVMQIPHTSHPALCCLCRWWEERWQHNVGHYLVPKSPHFLREPDFSSSSCWCLASRSRKGWTANATICHQFLH